MKVSLHKLKHWFEWKVWYKLGLPHYSVIRVNIQRKAKKTALWIWFNVFSKFMIKKTKINISGQEIFVDKENANEMRDKIDEIIVLAELLDYKVYVSGSWAGADRWVGHWVNISIKKGHNFVILQLMCDNIKRIYRKSHVRECMGKDLDKIEDIYEHENTFLEKIEFIKKVL